MRRIALVTLAVAVGTCGPGCAVGEEERARRRSDVPFGLLDPAREPVLQPTVPETPVGALAACFVDDDGSVVPVPVVLDERPSPLSAIDALASLAPDNPEGLSTVVPEVEVVDDVDVSAGVATVDLTEAFGEAVPASNQLLFVAQVVCTLTGLAGIGQVAFSVDGEPVEVPNAAGSLARGPVSRDDYSGLIRTAR